MPVDYVSESRCSLYTLGHVGKDKRTSHKITLDLVLGAKIHHAKFD